MNKFPPIQTVYKGHVYRSRLEAKYAVFFDRLGIKYEPEPEIFMIDAGGFYIRYQPDFVLPDIKSTEEFPRPLYVEVKGKDRYSDIYETERIKIEGFAKDHALLVLGNMPYQIDDLFKVPDTLFSFTLINGKHLPCFFNTYNGEGWLVDGYRIKNDPERVKTAFSLAVNACFGKE